MEDITPHHFIETVFDDPPDRVIYTHQLEDGRWRNTYVGRRTKIPVATYPTYFCVSTVDQQDYPRRSYKNVREAWVVVCDDVGTKASEPPVAPSYIIETSEGNYQWGYLIEPYDVSTAAGRQEYDSVLYSLVLAGYNDPGCRNASRVVRLPGSLHRTGFVARVMAWAPDRVWELEDILPAMGVEKHYPLSGSIIDAEPGKYSALEDVTDSVYKWLVAEGRVHGHNKDWVFIECPWRGEHTDGLQGLTSTAYSPEDYGSAAPPAFKCLHGHCAERGISDFKKILQRDGCTAQWGEEVDINILTAFLRNK